MGANAGTDAVKALCKLADDSDEWVRRNVAEALGTIELNPEASVPALAALLADEDEQVRFNAAYCAGPLRPDGRGGHRCVSRSPQRRESLRAGAQHGRSATDWHARGPRCIAAPFDCGALVPHNDQGDDVLISGQWLVVTDVKQPYAASAACSSTLSSFPRKRESSLVRDADLARHPVGGGLKPPLRAPA